MSKHYGKAMVARDGEYVTITNVCNCCGEQVMGPIHFTHLRSIAGMLNLMADESGIPTDLMQEVTKKVETNSDTRIADLKQQFYDLPVEPIAEKGGAERLLGTFKSAWDRVKETLH